MITKFKIAFTGLTLLGIASFYPIQKAIAACGCNGTKDVPGRIELATVDGCWFSSNCTFTGGWTEQGGFTFGVTCTSGQGCPKSYTLIESFRTCDGQFVVQNQECKSILDGQGNPVWAKKTDYSGGSCGAFNVCQDPTAGTPENYDIKKYLADCAS